MSRRPPYQVAVFVVDRAGIDGEVQMIAELRHHQFSALKPVPWTAYWE
jgi:hypothetical protein